jgi:hypothetical protein
LSRPSPAKSRPKTALFAADKKRLAEERRLESTRAFISPVVLQVTFLIQSIFFLDDPPRKIALEASRIAYRLLVLK